MQALTIPQEIAVWLIPVLLAITFHEAAHAYVASKLGDTTAKMLGRLSFNPFKHIDPIGTIIVPIVILIASHFSFIFGWAKPVPINNSFLKNPRKDLLLISAAGPLSNLLMAFLWACLLKLSLIFNPQASVVTLFVLLVSQAGIVINLLLAFLNLIPIPPLDGSKILIGILSPKVAYHYQKLEPYGFFILIALALTGILGWFLSPLLRTALYFLQTLFHL